MTTSTYFNHLSHANEQNLRDQLVVELIQMRGFDVYYFPREEVNVDELFGESAQNNFNENYKIEMMLEEASEGFKNEQLSMFGLDVKDKIELAVARSRFEDVVGIERPVEGAIIFIPAPYRSFWEVTLVRDRLFQQMGRREVWWLACDKMEYSQDEIAPTGGDLEFTDIDEIFVTEEDDAATVAEEAAELDVFDTESPFGDLG